MTNSPVSHRTQLAILSAGLLTFVGILVETSMNVTFPTLIKTLHVSLSTVQWLTSGYLLMVTLVMSTTAFLLRRFNTRLLFRAAICCALAGTLLCIWAPNFPILFAGRLLQALATGVSTPLMFHLILTTSWHLCRHGQRGHLAGTGFGPDIWRFANLLRVMADDFLACHAHHLTCLVHG